MKLSIHTTITNPERWRYPWRAALRTFENAADQVVVVDGGSDDGTPEAIAREFPRVQLITVPWPWEYGQEEFPRHLNAGFDACTGDWALKLDIDHLIHEDDAKELRHRLQQLDAVDHLAVATMEKFLVVNHRLGFRKAHLPVAIHTRTVGHQRVRYGRQTDVAPKLDDWCYPVEVVGTDAETMVPYGTAVPSERYAHTGVRLWNYNYTFRTLPQAREFFARTAAAWRRSKGTGDWGRDDDHAWHFFEEMVRGWGNRALEPLQVGDHPKAIRAMLEELTPEQFGYGNWSLL